MNENYHIAMIVDGHYPDDIRVRKEAETLTGQYKVSVICILQNKKPEYEIINGVHVHRIIPYRPFCNKALLDIFNAVSGCHPLFFGKVKSFIKNEHPDVLHVHDLPLANTVIRLSKKYGIPHVLDLHENYPEALQEWFRWRKNPIIRLKNKIFFNYSRWKKIEKSVLNRSGNIIAVAPEMKDFLVAEHAIDASRITVIENSEGKTFIEKLEKSRLPEVWASFKGKFILSYIGGIGPHRGLQTLIKALPVISKKIPEIHLVIAGSGHPDNLKYLRDLAERLQVADSVRFIGQQDFTSVPAMMKASHINVIPHEKNLHTEHTLPHKLYQIILSGAPLLVSDVTPLQRVVSESGYGFVFEAGNPGSLADEVIAMYNLQKNGKTQKLTNSYFTNNQFITWKNTGKRLLMFYHNLLNS